jgi:hypothetical protein
MMFQMLKLFLILQLVGLMLDTSEAYDPEDIVRFLQYGGRIRLCGGELNEVLSKVCRPPPIYIPPSFYMDSMSFDSK